jgi:hypothetical protein
LTGTLRWQAEFCEDAHRVVGAAISEVGSIAPPGAGLLDPDPELLVTGPWENVDSDRCEFHWRLAELFAPQSSLVSLCRRRDADKTAPRSNSGSCTM